MTELVELRPGRTGPSVFAARDLEPGAVVARVRGPVLGWRGDPGSEARHVLLALPHGDPEEPATCLDHACDPSCSVSPGLDVVTLGRVSAGEALTVSYVDVDASEYARSPSTYSWDDAWTFRCRCGSAGCLGTIDGFRVRGGPRELRSARDVPGLRLGPVAGKGRGVLAERSFAPGELVERVPVIVVPEGEIPDLERTALRHYWFRWGADLKGAAIALGWGSIYNHSFDPNAVYVRRVEEAVIEFVARRPIARGDEVTVNYSGDPEGARDLWFRAV